MRFISALFGTLIFATHGLATPAVIQPTEAASKDAFVYEFLKTMNFDGPGFGGILSSGKSVNPGHDTRSFLQFDFTGQSLAANEVATLNLFVVSGASVGFPFVDPSTAGPVTTELQYLTSSWNESAVTWDQPPGIGNVVIDTEVIDGIGEWVSFNITPLVSAWIADPSLNFGVAIMQTAAVNNGGSVMAVYESSSGENRPFVQIVPEPVAGSLVCAGLIAAGRRRRV